MRVIVLDYKNANKIINHFVAYGFKSFIVFTKDNNTVDSDYYRLNNIEVFNVNAFLTESTRDKLLKIKGSLIGRFFIVFSSGITDFSLDEIVLNHLLSQKTVTLIQSKNKLCSALAEQELFDYIDTSKNFELDTLTRIGEDNELMLYN
ncbi:MAG: hypothetical protein E7596_04630 [Ruminococcaceae bacterium]|nr:hypothetical protein [Oscillospiraceae bacterium]